MRKRLVLGNALGTLVAFAALFSLTRLGLGELGLVVVAFVLVVALTSIASIRVVNDLLRRLGDVEEAVLRVTHGETGVRLGDAQPPYDGLAYRLDQLFETVESVGERRAE